MRWWIDKNGAVVRKLIGYGYIASEHTETIGEFYARHLNPYLNLHRPCGFAMVSLDQRGNRRRDYKGEDYRTPLGKLTALERGARQMDAAKSRLLRQCKVQFPVPPPLR